MSKEQNEKTDVKFSREDINKQAYLVMSNINATKIMTNISDQNHETLMNSFFTLQGMFNDYLKQWDEENIYNQIIDEAYGNYCKSFDTQSEIESHSFDTDPMTKIMFVEKIKNLDWFSNKWGLKIEERELSLEERNDIYKKQWEPGVSELSHDRFDSLNIPTKLITLTYNNETIESYE
jgi:hypothetical protein